MIGSISGSLLVGSRHLGLWLAVGLVFWGAPIALIAAVSTAPFAGVMMAVIGAANSVFDIPLFTLPVRLASDDMLARVFGILEGLVAAGVALGSAVTPGLLELVGLRPSLIATGLLLPVVALAAWNRLRFLDRRLAVRDAEIGVLRAAPVLAAIPIPIPRIERLAARLRRCVVPPGTVLFDQGSPADGFYVIAEGHAEVVRDGAIVRRLGPGDGFGETALLHDIPRTATVRAHSELEVFEIDTDTFLDTVASNAAGAAAADPIVAGLGHGT